ncbi:MAG: hypothetical protein HYY50_01595 [Candidatus Kerfeldbacteria bacterium]|nr:hypothetical protein [Candidatus Kerfeldbacteria bacterium]
MAAREHRWVFRSRRRPGVVLLLAMLLMASVTASTIAVAVVINSTLGQSKNLDDFFTASAAADAGIERSLAVVKEGRKSGVRFNDGNPNNDNDVMDKVGRPPPSAPRTVTLSSSNASTAITSDNFPAPLTMREMAVNQTISFDILSTLVPYLVIKIECPEDTYPCAGQLEVSWNVIDSSGNSAFASRDVISSAIFDHTPRSYDLRAALSETGSGAVYSGGILGFRVHLRALEDELANLSVVPCAANTPTWEVPCTSLPEFTKFFGRLTISSRGTVGSAANQVQSLKTAAVLWQLPTPSLFNYVLFSEESIIP